MNEGHGANDHGHTDVSPGRLSFSKNFRIARKKAGLTQLQIRELTGFSQAWLSEVETGKSTISLDNMHVLAHAVGVPLWTLLLPHKEPDE